VTNPATQPATSNHPAVRLSFISEECLRAGSQRPEPSRLVPGHLPVAMSESPPSTSRKPDPRSQRTRDQLGNALIELLLAKPFDDITVQEVLDRAQVSRSTFYEHYSNKNDLFLSDVDDFFRNMSTHLERRNDPSQRIAPVTKLFTHIVAARDLYAALVASGRMHDVRELGEAHFARSMANRLERSPGGCRLPLPARTALAHALAGSLFSLLAWWVRQGMAASPAHMDELFHRMAAGSVANIALTGRT
jgi:AcrR family transcriptional regulator